jgi:ParB/RepB/Spo0J family partition protein
MDLEFHQLDLRYEQLRVRRPEREKRLLASLADRGQQVPIVVIPLAGELNRFLVIDGYKRIRALRQLKQDTVRATVWDMGEAEALVLDRSLRTSEHETALEQGWLLEELHRSLGLSFEDLARRFDRSVSWVSRRLALVKELPDSVQKHVREGKIGAQAAMKYLVPMARAKRYDCERLAEKIAYHQFTTQEVGVLYAAWRQGPIHVKNSIIDDPKLFLRARREIEQDDPVSARAGEELLRNLDMVGAVVRRAERQWREAVRTMDDGERENAWLCVQQAIADLTRLSEQMEKENGYVESEPADSDPGAAPQGDPSSEDCPRVADLARNSQESDPVGLLHPAAHCATGEGGAVPTGDPRPVQFLPWESGPGPRGAVASGSSPVLSNTDGLLPTEPDRPEARRTGRTIPFRASS